MYTVAIKILSFRPLSKKPNGSIVQHGRFECQIDGQDLSTSALASRWDLARSGIAVSRLR